MALRTIRIGMIGAGSIARDKHLPNLHKIAGVEVSAVCNRSRSSSEKVAREFRIPTVLNEWKEIVNRSDINVVWIAANPHLHMTATIAALDAGKHVFVQARMARTSDEAEAMYHKAIERPNLVTMICPSPVAMRGDLYVRKLLQEGFIGRIYSVRVQSLGAQFADPNSPLHWRQQTEISGVNTLALGIFHEVIQRWAGTASRVQALGKVFIKTRMVDGSSKRYEVRIPDDVMALVEFENGAQGTYHLSGVSRYASGDKIELFGSEGTLMYDVVADKLYGARHPQEKLAEMSIPSEFERTWTVEQDFVNAIRSVQQGQPWQVSPDFYEGLKYMEFVEGVFRSLHMRCAIDLPFNHRLSLWGSSSSQPQWV